MVIRRAERVVDERRRKNADGDGGASCDAAREHLQRAIDLLNGDHGNGDAAERRRISAIAVEHPGRIHTKSDPDAEDGEQDTAGLGKGAGDRDRCRDTDKGCEQPIARLFETLAAGGQCQDRHRDCSRGGNSSWSQTLA